MREGPNVRKRVLKKVWVGGAGLWVVIRATTILCSWNGGVFLLLNYFRFFLGLSTAHYRPL